MCFKEHILLKSKVFLNNIEKLEGIPDKSVSCDGLLKFTTNGREK
jgi:hypothetical protein